MKMKASAITAAALLALAAQAANAAEAVGYNTVTVPASSDVLVAAPFSRNAEASFTVASVTASGITVNEALSANTYSSSYYVRFSSGSGDGLWSTISANGDGGLEFANTNVLAYVSVGDALTVYKHHTISSLFPAGMKDNTWNSSTKILLPANDSSGINKGYTVVSYNSEEAKWKGGRTDYSNQSIVPGQSFIIRNESTTGLTWVAYGDVPSKVARILPTGDYDVAVAASVTPVSISELGLEGEGAILLPANDSTGYNKGATVVTYNSGEGKWKVGRTDYSNTEIPAGEGFIVRRGSDNTTASKWTVQY